MSEKSVTKTNTYTSKKKKAKKTKRARMSKKNQVFEVQKEQLSPSQKNKLGMTNLQKPS